MQIWVLIIISIAELALFFLLLRFFVRLRKSEDLLLTLSNGQQDLMEKLRVNSELERELVQSFAVRQAELQKLGEDIEVRAAQLRALLERAEKLGRSPQLLREVIVSGKKKGLSTAQLAKSAGISVDEVELILAQTSV
jgi:biopolymer transport protein ExbB/TolQ